RATSAHAFFRSLGMTFGVALGGAVLLSVVAGRIGDLEPVRLSLAGEEVALAGQAREAISAGYASAHAVAAGVVAIGLVPVLSLRRHLAARASGLLDR
ncbi:MAG: hypothetical protein ACRDVM_05425, partial [Acidimicrobiia bacterium]